MKRTVFIVQYLSMFILTLFVMSQINAQDMEGFDPNAKPVPDFELTPFYETKLEYVGKKQGDLLKTESIQAPEGAVIAAGQNEILEWFDNRLNGLPVPKENN